MMHDFSELIQRSGLEAARSELERRKAAVLARENLDPQKFQALTELLGSIDREFRQACADAFSNVVAKSPAPGDESVGASSTQAEWVLGYIRQAEGQVFGPDLYDAWERTGGNRRAIQTTVSQLIAAKRITKGGWKKGGRPGSWLHLANG